MKTKNLIVTFALSALAMNAWAAPDRSYYVTELVTQQKFDVYNDGRNTYLESIPGLVVTGATADGEFYIVKGVPNQIKGFMNGKPITFLRGAPPAPKAAPRPDAAAVNAELKRLTEELSTLTKASEAKRPIPPVGGNIAAPGAAGAPKTDVAATVTTRPATPQRATDIALWRVTPSDGNLRLLIDKWSSGIGWKAIWDVDRDIPIESTDEKSADFKTAVRRVLASTELGDVQVKPCFYSNQVIRIVRKTTKCNPTE
jgi:hypothetical protein